MCLCVSRADGQCSPLRCITLRSVTRVCHGAWEPKRSHVIPPSYRAAQHLPPLQPRSEIFSQRTDGEREGEPLLKCDPCRLSGEKSACCGPCCSPGLLSDSGTMGGVEREAVALMFCMCVCVHAALNICMSLG